MKRHAQTPRLHCPHCQALVVAADGGRWLDAAACPRCGREIDVLAVMRWFQRQAGGEVEDGIARRNQLNPNGSER